MLRVWISILVLLAFALAGCLAAGFQGAIENRPPEAYLWASVTEGRAPLEIEIRDRVFDPDGDDLFVVFRVNGARAEFDVPGGGAQPTEFEHVDVWEINVSRVLRLELDVSDGIDTAHASLVLNITGPTHIFVWNVTAHVDSPCAGCRVAEWPAGGTGARACHGFLTDANGTDCTWIPLDAGLVDRTAEVYTERANIGVEIRTSCAFDGEPIERWGGGRFDRQTIPEGAACAVLWVVDEAPTDIVFRVYR